MDNHRTDHHVLHLSICLELIRTITIQSIPFDTRFLSFHPEQSNTLYQRFDRYSFLISSFLPENCLLLLYLYGIVFERIFFKQKGFPMLPVINLVLVAVWPLLWQNFVFYTPVNQLYTFINPEYGMRYIYVYYALFLIPLCSVFLSGRKENRYISIAFPLLLIAFSCYSIYSSPTGKGRNAWLYNGMREEQQWDRVLQTIHTE